ncbi:hypothetical protein PQX77_019339 [Marasmius sp. AFHP31]|nr:hypothetical protein PQX77_019339 [Marasmius sp. AFHP31]
MSTFFPSSRNFSVNGGHFSHVGGDQHNHYNHASTSSADGRMLITQGGSLTTMTVHVSGDQINQIVQQKEREHIKFDNFRNVRQGDFCRLRDIGIKRYRRDCPCMRGRYRCWYCKRDEWKVDRIICLAEVDGSPGQVYTAVSYSGPDARKAFEADFQTYSTSLTSQAAQLYAIDIGAVPSLLLRNELVPLAHVQKHVSWSVTGLHLHTLLRQWGCRGEEVWIDSARGVLCRGPAGPDSGIWGGWDLEIRDMPSTVDFLQEDVVLRFLASRESWKMMFIQWMAVKHSHPGYVPELVNPNTAEVISTLSSTPIAIAAHHDETWDGMLGGNLLERTLLENGLCRFQLGSRRSLELNWGFNAQIAWLSQAWSVFHALGITVKDDLKALVLTYPDFIELEGSLSRSRAKRQRRLQQPIYLFVRPLPRGYLALNDTRKFKCQTSSLHYWSLRKDGDPPLSHKTCHYFGLPTVLHLTCRFCLSSWTTHDYKIIHQYQLLRGLDPKTTDFARHVGSNRIVFQPIINLAQIEEVHEDQNSRQPLDPHVDFIVYDSDYHTSDSDGDSATDLGDSSDSGSDCSTDLDDEPSSEGLSNAPEQGQLADLASSSSFQTQDVAEREFAINLDGGASKRQRIGTGYGPQAERIERYDHLDQTSKYLHHKNNATTDNQTTENPDEGVRPICPLPKRAMFSTDLSHQAYWSTDMESPLAGCTDLVLSASQGLHSCSSASMDPSWTDILFGTPLGMTTVPFHPAQPFESLSMPQPGMVATSYEDAGAERGSVYANQSIHSVGPSNTAFISDTSEYAGWSRSQFTPFAATSSSLYDAPRFDTPAVGIQCSNVEWSNTRNYTPSSTAPDNSFHDTSTFDTASTVSSSASSRIATIPFQIAQPVGPLRISQPESVATCYEGAGAEPGSVYANPTIHSAGPSNTTFISDTSEYAGWSRSRVTPIVATSSSLYNALGSDTPAVGYPFSPTA